MLCGPPAAGSGLIDDIILIYMWLRCYGVAYRDGTSGPSTLGAEVERLKSIVSSQFEVYDIRVTYDAVVFFVDCNSATLESNFDSIRRTLVPINYIPFLQKRGGEYTITVGKRKPVGRKGNIPNIILLAATLISTTIAGAFLWAGYYNSNNIWTLGSFLNGMVYFVTPVMLILGTHEMGHFLVARRFRVNASLPYFIPSIPPLGTLGAFISIRDPFPNRKALLEIGIAGPIAGFLVTIPVAFVGFYLTQMNPVLSPPLTPGTQVFTVPYLYSLMLSLFPFSSNLNIFPTAFAAWVGFFATALNLLPAGQLDGGHVARALLGEKSKYLGWAAILGMVLLSFEFESWILIALFVLLVGVRHPPPLNDISKLKVSRKMLGVVALAMFLVTFTPFPIVTVSSSTSFTISSSTQLISMNSASSVQYFNITVVNTGNVREAVNITQLQNANVVATFAYPPGGGQYGTFIVLNIDPGATASASVRIAATSTIVSGTYILQIQGSSNGYVSSIPITVNYS